MPHVFISYAREDCPIAERVFKELEARGYEPWMDTKNLLPGERWKSVIRNTIRQSAFVLVLISNNSINKRGFVQTELLMVLDELARIPPNQIFLIPVRLEDCQPIHDALQEVNWVDLFPSFERGLEKIVEALGQSPKGGRGSWLTGLFSLTSFSIAISIPLARSITLLSIAWLAIWFYVASLHGSFIALLGGSALGIALSKDEAMRNFHCLGWPIIT